MSNSAGRLTTERRRWTDEGTLERLGIPNKAMNPSLDRMSTGGIASLVGASYCLLVARLPWDFLERVRVPLIGFLIPSVLVFVLSGPIASRCHTRGQLYSAGMLALLGMFIANIANVVYDSYVGGEDHNLFPFEILALILVGSPGLLFRFLPDWPEK
jgi:hypothetical protein